jgi:hypothetical protein
MGLLGGRLHRECHDNGSRRLCCLLAKYIHDNPVRCGLVSRADDWPWSSAADWAGKAAVMIKVDRGVPFERP